MAQPTCNLPCCILLDAAATQKNDASTNITLHARPMRTFDASQRHRNAKKPISRRSRTLDILELCLALRTVGVPPQNGEQRCAAT